MLLTSEVWNTICNSFQIEWSELHQIWSSFFFFFFDKKSSFTMLTIFDILLAPILKEVSVSETINPCQNPRLHCEIKYFYLSLFQKLRKSDTCNKVKSCSKHGLADPTCLLGDNSYPYQSYIPKTIILEKKSLKNYSN